MTLTLKDIEQDLKENNIRTELQKHVYLYLRNNTIGNFTEINNHLKEQGFDKFQLNSVIKSLKNKKVLEVISRGQYKVIYQQTITDEILYELRVLLGLYKTESPIINSINDLYSKYKSDYIEIEKTPIKSEMQQRVIDYIKDKGNVTVYELRLKVFTDDETALGGVVRDLESNNRIQRGLSNKINLIEDTEYSLQTYIYNILQKYNLTVSQILDEKDTKDYKDFNDIYYQLVKILIENTDEKVMNQMDGTINEQGEKLNKQSITQLLYNFMQNKEEYTADEIRRYIKEVKGTDYQEYVAINGLRVRNKLKRVNVGKYIVIPHSPLFKRLKGMLEFLLSDYESIRGSVKDKEYSQLFTNVCNQIKDRRVFNNITDDDVLNTTNKVYDLFKEKTYMGFGEVGDKLVEMGGNFHDTPNHLRALKLKNKIRYVNGKYRIMEKRTQFLKEDIQDILDDNNETIYELYKSKGIKEFLDLYNKVQELIK